MTTPCETQAPERESYRETVGKKVRINLDGQRFGRLLVLAYAHTSASAAFWRCRCDCGAEVVVQGRNLRTGRTRSCGCIRSRHGHAFRIAPGKQRPAVYTTWGAMMDRCTRPGNPNFARYGGRGITVCERWRTFENFLADMGEPPPGRTLDRIDNDGPYSPENCRWATPQEQGLNKQGNRRITIDGVTRPLTEWARIGGLDPRTVTARIDQSGWPARDAVTLPLKKGFSLKRRALAAPRGDGR